jgi:hypothetical protein
MKMPCLRTLNLTKAAAASQRIEAAGVCSEIMSSLAATGLSACTTSDGKSKNKGNGNVQSSGQEFLRVRSGRIRSTPVLRDS